MNIITDILYEIGPVFVYASDDVFSVSVDEFGHAADFDDLDDAIDYANEVYDDL